jgi:hypothetical protein
MRKAVRAVKFKITKIETTYAQDYLVIQEAFHTDIPEALWDSTLKVRNDWAAEIFYET